MVLRTDPSQSRRSSHSISESQRPRKLHMAYRSKVLHDQNLPEDIKVHPGTLETSIDDPEIRPEITTLTTTVQTNKFLGSSRFARFSQWPNLVKAVSVASVTKSRKQAETVIVTNLQHEARMTRN